MYTYNRKSSSHYDHEQSYTSNVHPMHFWRPEDPSLTTGEKSVSRDEFLEQGGRAKGWAVVTKKWKIWMETGKIFEISWEYVC